MENFTRTRMARLIELDRQIKADKYPNCSSFARYLADSWGTDKPFDRKTIQRDIDFLRDQLHAPVEYDQTKKGYFYREKSWSFPMLDLTEGELLQLLLAEQMSTMFVGTPIAGTLDRLFEKIRCTLSNPEQVDPVFFRRQFSFHGHPVRSISEKIWTSIFHAMRKDLVISINYQGIQDDGPTTRKVEPIHLGCVDGEWFLVAWCRKRNEMRHFAVSRISSVKLTEDVFDLRDFDPDVYFSNCFGRYIGKAGEERWITVKFKSSATQWIKERIWHRKQKLTQHRDGSVTLSFPAPSLFEAKRWVLQWGKEAEVVEPEELAAEVRNG